MQPFSATELLDLWERACTLPQRRRPAALLSVGAPEPPVDDLASLTVGARDAALLVLREQLFGSHLAVLADCPGCGAHLEAACTTGALRAPQPAEANGPLSFHQGEWEILFRLPTTGDLDLLRSDSDLETNRALLLEQCVFDARQAEHDVPIHELPPEIVTALGEAIADADPQADVQLALVCPQCGHRWNAPFDIASFLWAELEAGVQRLLQEVHDLARAYGWSETDILAMSAVRRNAYLQRAHA